MAWRHAWCRTRSSCLEWHSDFSLVILRGLIGASLVTRRCVYFLR